MLNFTFLIRTIFLCATFAFMCVGADEEISWLAAVKSKRGDTYILIERHESTQRFFVVHYRPDGGLDRDFGTLGFTEIPADGWPEQQVVDIALGTDGSVFFIGEQSNSTLHLNELFLGKIIPLGDIVRKQVFYRTSDTDEWTTSIGIGAKNEVYLTTYLDGRITLWAFDGELQTNGNFGIQGKRAIPRSLAGPEISSMRVTGITENQRGIYLGGIGRVRSDSTMVRWGAQSVFGVRLSKDGTRYSRLGPPRYVGEEQSTGTVLVDPKSKDLVYADNHFKDVHVLRLSYPNKVVKAYCKTECAFEGIATSNGLKLASEGNILFVGKDTSSETISILEIDRKGEVVWRADTPKDWPPCDMILRAVAGES